MTRIQARRLTKVKNHSFMRFLRKQLPSAQHGIPLSGTWRDHTLRAPGFRFSWEAQL